MFEAFKRWRRERVILRHTLDAHAWRAAMERLPFLRGLTPQELQRLERNVILFLHEKSFSGAAGQVVDEEMRVFVAAQACLLILNLDIDFFRGWVEIIVYPDQFVPTHSYTDEFGVAHTERVPHVGEAWLAGPVILSWADAARSRREDGVNVVIHEFAHKLDMLNGEADGFPPLHKGMRRDAWSTTFSRAYEDFCRRVDADEETEIDPYAAENPAEFFAVMSEAFFETPEAVFAPYPDVYQQLALYYRQDPRSRLRTTGRVETTGASVRTIQVSPPQQ